MIAEGSGLIRVVENDEPPFVGRWLAPFRHESQLCRYSPRWAGMEIDLFLERRNDLDDFGVGENGAAVDDCYFDGHGELPPGQKVQATSRREDAGRSETQIRQLRPFRYH